MEQNNVPDKNEWRWAIFGGLFIAFVIAVCAMSPHWGNDAAMADDSVPGLSVVTEGDEQFVVYTGDDGTAYYCQTFLTDYVYEPVDESYGGAEGDMPTVDEDGNTVYEHWEG